MPPFEDYAMKGRTYRYFEGDAALSLRLWLELHDLHLQRLTVPTDAVTAGRPVVGGSHGDQYRPARGR